MDTLLRVLASAEIEANTLALKLALRLAMILAIRASFARTGYLTDLSDKVETVTVDLSTGATAFLDMRGDANAQEKRAITKRRMEMIENFMFSKSG